jgi:serine/threonine protein kinase
MFKIAYSKDVPDIPESFSKDGKDFLRLCLKRDPAQRPSATQLLGHPFLQEHQGTRVTKCNNIAPLRNRPSFTAEAWQQEVIYLTCFFLIQRHLQYYFLNKRLAQTGARSVLNLMYMLYGYSPEEGIHQQRGALLLFWTSKDRAREILQGFPLLILHPAKPPGTVL